MIYFKAVYSPRKVERERGRDRGLSSSASRLPSSRSRRTRSLSPLGASIQHGRAMDRDPLKKYSANFRKHDQDVRDSGSMWKRRGRVSAHEHHYMVNRA
ncbi:hypothetical protein Tco_0384613, partial [Tanacetum coccineum]